jgi:NAD(P)-dependent dehydrogenase (short-subunit alcohol dehydrogenase family)
VLDQFKAGVPLGRFGTADELANLCLFLASDEASYLTGQTINCDGGSFMA